MARVAAVARRRSTEAAREDSTEVASRVGASATRQSETNGPPPMSADGLAVERLVVPLRELDRSMLPLGGGKAVNLGELIRADLPVPPGVCLTTVAYAREAIEVQSLVDQLSEAEPGQRERLGEQIRARLTEVAIQEEVRLAIEQAVRELGETTLLAVRSSATAEDLPFASFAGQQETILNVSGAAAVLDA